MRNRLLLLDRQRLTDIVKSMTPAGQMPACGAAAQVTEWEFGAPNRSDEEVAAEHARALAAKAATGGFLFVTEDWVLRARAHADAARAEIALDAVNMAIDPVEKEPEVEVTPKRAHPNWVHRVGVKNDEGKV